MLVSVLYRLYVVLERVLQDIEIANMASVRDN
jgi:hypothetical protein